MGLRETGKDEVSGQQCSIYSPTDQLALPGGADSSLSVLGAPGSKEKGAADSSGKMTRKSHGRGQSRHKDNKGNSMMAGQCGRCVENNVV